MDYPKTITAAKKVKRSEWGLGDALLDEIGPRGSETRFHEAAEALKAEGIDYSPKYLKDLHAASRAFPPDSRESGLTPRNALAAGTPAIWRKADELAEEQGVPTTQRHINEVRKASVRATRQRHP